MRNRWLWFWICAVAGVLMAFCGWLVPVHLRAVDSSIIEKAGRRTSGLVEAGLKLVNENKLGAAQLTLQAAQTEALPNREKLAQAVTNLASSHPGWQSWGGGERYLEVLFET